MKTSVHLVAGFTASVMLLLGAGQANAQSYTFTTIVPGGLSEGGGINDANQAVGYYAIGSQFGYIWDNGNLSVFGSSIAPFGISNTGQIVGAYALSTNSTEGFSYSGGTFSGFQDPAGINTSAGGVNASGTIVGSYQDAATGSFHGFVLNGDAYTTLDVPGATWTQAAGISDNGSVVGVYRDSSGTQHGFEYNGSNFSYLDVPGGLQTIPFGINNAGEVSGSYEDVSGAFHGFIFDGHSYATLDFPGAANTYVYKINSFGSVSGTWDNGPSVSRRAFVAIVPVPEPETYAMLLAGLGLIGFLGCRGRKLSSWFSLVSLNPTYSGYMRQ
jgi:probable HAF family extracellular repeat protein